MRIKSKNEQINEKIEDVAKQIHWLKQEYNEARKKSLSFFVSSISKGGYEYKMGMLKETWDSLDEYLLLLIELKTK